MIAVHHVMDDPISKPPRHWRPGFIQASLFVVAVGMITSWIFILMDDAGSPTSFFSGDTTHRIWDFLGDLAGASSQRLGTDGSPLASLDPAFTRLSEWKRIGTLAIDTVVMGILGVAIAACIAIATFMFGARNVMIGELAPAAARTWAWPGFISARGLFVVSRGVPELVWALLIVFVFFPGILPGALALGIHNGGILGKLSSEIVEGLDRRPIRALRSTGANHLQVLIYGVLPQAIPRFITYLLYRCEVIIRTTVVVGFVAGGLGMELMHALNMFDFTMVTLILIYYLTLVIAVDILAAWLRCLGR